MPCSSKMRKCRIDCEHRRFVEEYRIHRTQFEEAEYAKHPDDRTDKPGITFKEWLMGSRKKLPLR